MSDYARILTNSSEMKEILELVQMKGVTPDGQTKALVEDTIIHFTEDSFWVKAFDPMASVWVHVQGEFEGVRNPGTLVIGDIGEFTDYLGRFGENCIVAVEEESGVYYLTFDDEERKTGRYSATDEAHIKSVQDVEALPYEYNPEEHDYPGAHEQGIVLDTWFACNVSDINDAIKDGDTTGIRKYPIASEDGFVQIKVGDAEGWIETTFDAEGEGEARSVYGYGVDNIFGNLSGEIEVYFTENSVSWIHQSVEDGNNDFQIDYMMAEDEEET